VKLRELGERRIIKICIREISKKYDYEHDDVSYTHLDEGRMIVSNIEGYVIDRWKLPFTTWRDCGWRACAGACSDLVAKFSRPLGAGLSIDVPGELEDNDVLDIVKGFLEFLDKYGMYPLKMDTNESICASITSYVIGLACRKIPQKVSKECDIFTRPVFGYTGIVLKLYYMGKLADLEKDNVVKRGIEMIRRPDLDTEILNLDSSKVIASTDSSDGLGASLWSIAEISNIRIVLEQLPTSQEIVEFCKQFNIDPLEVVFNGGEEYVPIIFTDDDDLKRDLESLGYVRVGYVEAGEPLLRYGKTSIPYRGWEYFKSCYT